MFCHVVQASDLLIYILEIVFHKQGIIIIIIIIIVVVVVVVGLDDRGSMVRFPTGAGNFSLHHRVQNGSGAHPASYLMGTRGSFPGGKAAAA
jgi:hypothetical protein